MSGFGSINVSTADLSAQTATNRSPDPTRASEGDVESQRTQKEVETSRLISDADVYGVNAEKGVRLDRRRSSQFYVFGFLFLVFGCGWFSVRFRF